MLQVNFLAGNIRVVIDGVDKGYLVENSKTLKLGEYFTTIQSVRDGFTRASASNNRVKIVDPSTVPNADKVILNEEEGVLFEN